MKLIKSALFVIAVSALLSFVACKGITLSKYEVIEKEYEVNYIVDEQKGYLDGIATQTVRENCSTSQVKVFSNEKYRFIGWDDGNESSERSDVVKDESLTFTAIFERVYRDLNVTITADMPEAVVFEGQTEQVVHEAEQDFQPVSIQVKFGYEFLYYEVGGKKYYSDTIDFDLVDSHLDIVVHVDYAVKDLPIVKIDTQSMPIIGKTDYVDMTFDLVNCSDALSNVSGGIRLRGNSTLNYDKKPYRLKFDKKQSLFGLKKSKSWVLLADYLDPSCLHNYTALTLGNKMENLPFTPTPNKVNVYLNDEYVGLYTLCEQIQENEGRINIEKTITEDMKDLKDFNFYIAMDQSVAADQDAVLDETYFYLDEYNRYIELKYPEKTDFTSDEQFYKFFADLKSYIADLFATFTSLDSEKIVKETNVGSLIDYYLVDAVMGEVDHAYKSFNMYYTCTSKNFEENGKLNFGPIWDYDWSLLTPWTGKPCTGMDEISTRVAYSNVFFKALQNEPSLTKMTKERYFSKMSPMLDDFISSVNDYGKTIYDSLKLNSIRWYDDPISLLDNNLKFLNDYLSARKKRLDTYFSKR